MVGHSLCSDVHCKMTSPPISHCQRVQVLVLRRILRMGAVWTPWLAPLRNTAYSSLTTLLNQFPCTCQALINACLVWRLHAASVELSKAHYYTLQSPCPLTSVFYSFSINDCFFFVLFCYFLNLISESSQIIEGICKKGPEGLLSTCGDVVNVKAETF